jgi:hypothetical protein
MSSNNLVGIVKLLNFRSTLLGVSASMHISDTIFSGFNLSDCGLRSFAVSWNPTQIDFSPEVFFTRVQFSNSPKSSWFYFPSCSEGSCDGRQFIIIHDEDGSVTGTSGNLLGQGFVILCSILSVLFEMDLLNLSLQKLFTRLCFKFECRKG